MIPSWAEERCGHVRRLTGVGEDGNQQIEAWYCDECGDFLIDRPHPSLEEGEQVAQPAEPDVE